ncbi:MAG: primosomal protein N' [Clostridia bacterium]|nr:primosomal protein N' [Clostridia bacterium]
MYAEIVVNHPSRAVDRVFDYKIPDTLAKKVRPGSRVIIPFSQNNAEREGFVLRVKEHTDAKRIKSIIGMASDEVAYRPDMVELIEYMHTRYLATYIELIHTLIPTGTGLKTVEWILLSDTTKFGKTDKDIKILELLSDNGGGMDIYSLQSYFNTDIKARLSRLEKADAIKREFHHSRNINKHKIRAVRLAVTDEEADIYAEKTRSKIQKRMILMLKDNEFISTADIVRFSMGNYSALSALDKNGITEFFDLTLERQVYETTDTVSAPPEPTEEQKKAIFVISDALNLKKHTDILLHGVTGSGKTEVFLRAIEHTVNMGRSALVLVPEISLTPQMVSRFVSRFGKRIAILHSGLSLGERYDQWSRIMNGEADIVIGARSAVFAPLSDIGIIIIDEEHSETYKSEMSPRYHAREVAIKRAEMNGAVTLMASATPSIESYTNALRGNYKLIEMHKRYNEASMPAIEIVDMREELENGNKSMFSKSLYEAIQKNIENGEQTILFMNRRGFSTFVSCRKCGFVPQCPNCNISLTYHSYDNSLKCHYCGHKQPNYTKCPLCGSEYIRYFGGGTQRIEDEVKRLFPGASVIRLDADVTTRKNSHKKILDSFVNDKIDIMIGTQMVSKGLDFSNVTLVGVMSADTMLHINDFRSGERTFDLLEQVSGRAGRGEKTGRAIIQTYNPENYAIDLVKTHDYRAFYKKTITERHTMWYPPYSEMICIRFSGDDNETTRKGAFLFRDAFGDITKIPEKLAVLGPIPSGVSRIKGKYRWQILIKCENADLFNDRLVNSANAVKNDAVLNEVQIQIDKNPINIY